MDLFVSVLFPWNLCVLHIAIFFAFFPPCNADLGRMYNLVSRITDGLGELKKLLETHIHNQGLAAIEKCGESALNVRQQSPNKTQDLFPIYFRTISA